MSAAQQTRQYHLDWLRAFGMLAVFFYHVGMFLNSWDWHVKAVPVAPGFDIFSRLLITWLMPLFFVVSGVGAYHALSRRSWGAFARERLLRLGVPLLMGIFLLSPHQVYVERLTHGQFEGSFWTFLPRYFDGLYLIEPTGNFAWMGLHLWYLLVLLLFSLITLPLLRPVRAWAAPRIGPVGLLVTVPLALFLLEGALDLTGLDFGVSGWPMLSYLAFYLLGYALFTTEAFQQATRSLGRYALSGAILTSLPVAMLPLPDGSFAADAIWALVKVFNCWLWLVAFIYLSERYVNRKSPVLVYANQAVMPFYILHQPVIVAIAFAIRTAPLHPLVKFLLLAAAAFAIIMGICHFLIRRVRLLQFLCGLKPAPAVGPGQASGVNEERQLLHTRGRVRHGWRT